MSAERFVDFDRAFAEREQARTPLRVRLFAQDWELPASMPAAVPLKVARYMANGRSQDDLTQAETLDLASDMIPGDVLKAWFDKGLDVDRLGPIVEWVLGQYMAAEGVSAEGEALAPEPGASESTPSPNGGASSKPTSPASTPSISQEISPG